MMLYNTFFLTMHHYRAIARYARGGTFGNVAMCLCMLLINKEFTPGCQLEYLAT